MIKNLTFSSLVLDSIMDVSFVVMPFGSIQRPALGVSLLKSGLSRFGFASTIHYLNLKFSKIIGSESYRKISEYEYADSLIGELIFAPFVSDYKIWSEAHIAEILQDILRVHDLTPRQINELTEISYSFQMHIPTFLEDCVKLILADNPKIIGFTSTFHQTCSSLALAKLLKQQTNTPIIFGGANCEGQMGSAILANFDFVDYVCSGEGDIAFPVFVRNFIDNSSLLEKINGIVSRHSDELRVHMTSPVMEMNSLPYPDFEDFFVELNKDVEVKKSEPILSVETSRGCWWGEKFQCTFCGLNGSTMNYRSKSAIRAVEELEFLSKQYRIQTFQIVDNILDIKYFKEFFPMLFEKVPSLNLFYETKSNLSKKQLQMMKRAGVSAIQPGIESFSTPILKLMKKGVTAIQNIQTLKWCTELGIFPYWNVLWGFAGEHEEEYVKMSTLIEKLVHLYPPTWFGRIILDRFSPYFVNPVECGIVNVRPISSYRYVYSTLTDKELSKIAYHFDFDYIDGRQPSTYIKELRSKLNDWKSLWNTDGSDKKIPSLTFSRLFDEIIIIRDTRPCRTSEFHSLVDEAALIYDTCEILHSFTSIAEKVRSLGPPIDDARIRKLLSEMIEDKIIIQENEAYLSLALPHSPSQSLAR
jgi:ribosomal peptide maturation radical SAM protein 1